MSDKDETTTAQERFDNAMRSRLADDGKIIVASATIPRTIFADRLNSIGQDNDAKDSPFATSYPPPRTGESP